MRQIIALGGGGFSMEPDNPLLDLYILQQCGKRRPKVCFIPTASGDSEDYIQRFYRAFGRYECTPSHLSLFRPPSADLEAYVLDHDVLYVGGGNTRNLLVLWKAWGLDRILRAASADGRILAGISAGSICWFEQGVTDSYPGRLAPIAGLGLLPGSNCPHYDGEPERRPAYHRLLAAGEIAPGIAVDDGAALHFVDEDLVRVVSSRPGAGAYRLELVDGTVREEAIQAEYLGAV